ncbi:unnamed protein product [Angiostrongylus costaricensis]|uniref:G_PROTEIN_RECEP_F1_2 domain-containing protein n=1 Tax=Angiostrongylus costaricensis TaxID=334426 RepID=A0A158PE89_ANGCS|nr:unnamed protein product [Angiostrongylus costaricensis]
MSVWSSKAFWPLAPACYHEPRVHDHSLYFYLRKLNVYLLLPIAVMGIVFNASALAFLYRPPRITSGVSVYLKALLIMDHAQLFTTVATVFMPQVCDLHHSGNHTLYGFCMFERRFLKHAMPRIEATVNTIHVWTIAALSAHRYWKVSRPVAARMKDTTSKAHCVLLLMFVAALLFRLPTFLFELQTSWRPILLITKRIDTTEILSPYRFVYHSILDPLLDNILPFIWMSLFSLMTLSEIFRSRHLEYQKLGNLFSKETGIKELLAQCFIALSHLNRQRQKLRATVSIVSVIVLYLLLHTLRLYLIARKWQLLIKRQCPTRSDYFHSYVAYLFSMTSASVNAFVFIGFTNRVRNCVQVIIRRTSQKLLTYTDAPLPARSTQESYQLQKE